MDYVRKEHEGSIRMACKTLSISRTVYGYKPNLRKEDPVIKVLLELADKYPRYGFGKMFQMIMRQGHSWNHKRVFRVYCLIKLNICRKGKKRLPSRNPEVLTVPLKGNVYWSVDFMSDALITGQRFRTFNVIDDFNREILDIEVDTNLPSARVVRVLDLIAAWRGDLEKLRMDNGSYLISVTLAGWAEKHNVMLDFIKPGKPT